MPMPSLLKYFAFVGAALFAALSLVNFLLDPSTGATPVASVPAKRTIVVQHDPRASKIERWRDEQAALKAAEQTQTTAGTSAAAKPTVALVTKPAPEPARPAPAPIVQAAAPAPQPAAQPAVQAAPQPAPQLAAAATAVPEPAQPQPAVVTATDTSMMVGVDETTDQRAAKEAEKAAERKAKIARAKARKEKLARDRAMAAQTEAGLNGHYPRTASNTQDQYYYGQRGGQQPFTTRYSSSAFAPQPSFGPFGWGGRGW
jgi:hypothetical protein